MAGKKKESGVLERIGKGIARKIDRNMRERQKKEGRPVVGGSIPYKKPKNK